MAVLEMIDRVCLSCASLFQSEFSTLCLKCMMQGVIVRKESEAANLERIKLENIAQKAKAIRRKNRPKDKAKPIKKTKCFLCGAMVEFMREHKHKVHGESLILPSPTTRRPKNLWLTIYEGGSPGLGKKSS